MKENTQGINITIKFHNLQNETEAYKICNHAYNDTKWNQKNMKQCGKRNSNISSKLRMIHTHTHTHTHIYIYIYVCVCVCVCVCVGCNADRYPVTKTITI